ncbi:LuxR C-terminal-related transcriptional regulator [Streptomyces sp. NPDC085460]|uniref:helix-turn-helix transcriptional regulator n=1 Tax=Streptomyces sp. NPDC085460 TaxID=3365723 RepID=UPI0037D58B44
MQETERTTQRRDGGRSPSAPEAVVGWHPQRLSADPPEVRLADWPASVALVRDTVLRASVGDLCLMLTPELLDDPGVFAQVRTLSSDAVAGGARVRVLLQVEAENCDALAGHIRRMADTGARMRAMSRSGGPMVVIDDDLAVLPTLPDLSTRHCTLLRGRALVAAYRALFDTAWRLNAWEDGLGFPLGHPSHDPIGLTAREREALQLLAEGLTDEGISRRTGLSVRTLRRVIAGVMLRMGAQSRFQAGAEAARRHLI